MDQMPAIYQMTDIHQVLVSEYKRPPFTINDTRIPVKEQIPDSDHKRPSFLENDTNMPADE